MYSPYPATNGLNINNNNYNNTYESNDRRLRASRRKSESFNYIPHGFHSMAGGVGKYTCSDTLQKSYFYREGKERGVEGRGGEEREEREGKGSDGKERRGKGRKGE